MLVQSTRLRVLLSAVVLALAHGAHAQDIASNLDQLRVLVRSGDSLTVTDAAGDELRGKLYELSATSLVMQARGHRYEFSGDDIRRITQAQHADLGTGAKWGFGVGAGIGLLAMTSVASNCHGCGAFVLVNTVMFGGVGAGTGVAIAASIMDQRVIYSRPGLPARIAVAPLIDRDRQGIRVSLRF
jgi:hypothetical protein